MSKRRLKDDVPELPAELFPGDKPELHRFPWETFEELCRAILQREPQITTIEMYGTRGQTQFGIDTLAYREDGNVEVAQCKRYAKFDSKKLKAASEAFLDHWDSRWKDESVKRFVLIVACSLQRTEIQNEILAQKRSFRRLGVAYEAWSDATILDKIAPHRDLAERYFASRPWPDVICGVRENSIQHYSGLQQEALLQSLAERVEREFQQTKRKWQEGCNAEVKEWVTSIKQSAEWAIAKASVKADILRIEAYLVLATSPDRARSLIEEAAQSGRTPEQIKLEAYLALKTDGSEAAFQILGNCDVPLLNNFKAAVRLEEGDIDSCLQHLRNATADDPEALRLRALAHLFCRLPERALADIELAEQLAGHRLAIKETAAVIRFYQMVAPSALPRKPWHLKTPIELVERKSDPQSLALLTKAVESFDHLSHQVQDDDHRFELQSWKVVGQLCHPQLQDGGTEELYELLTRRPGTPSLIHWALCFTSLDLHQSTSELKQRLRADELQAEGILALVHLLLSSGNPVEAQQILQVHQQEFSLGKEVWTQWYCRSLLANGQSAEALKTLDSQGDSVILTPLRLSLLRTLGQIGLEEYLLALEKHADQTGDGQLLLQACEIQSQNKRWEWVHQRSEKLLSSVPTPRATLLSMVAAYNTGRSEQCLELASRVFTVDFDFSKLKFYSLLSLGRGEEALAEGQYAADTFGADGLTLLAHYFSTRGDTVGLREIGQRILKLHEVGDFPLLHLSRNLLVEDLPLARELWIRAAEQGIGDDQHAEALLLGLQLGLNSRDEWAAMFQKRLDGTEAADQETETLSQRLHEMRTQVGGEYFAGASIHAVSRQMGTTLAYFFHEIPCANAAEPEPLRQLPIFCRSGAHSLAEKLPQGRNQLCLDLTSLLLAQQLGVMEELVEYFPGLRLPPSTQAALQNLAILHAPPQNSDADFEQSIQELVQSRTIQPLEGAESVQGFKILDWGRHRPDRHDDTMFSPSGLFSWLNRNGRISKTKFSDAARFFQFPDSDETSWEASGLVCSVGALSAFHQLGLLKTIAESVRLYYPEEDYEGLRAAAELRKRSSLTVAWIRDLVDKIKHYLLSGSVTVLAMPQKLEDGPEFGSLQEVLSVPDEDLVVSIDDRYINSFTHQEKGVPLFSLLDILHCLRTSGKLDDERYFFLILRCRAANLHYLPVKSDEILHQLAKATIIDHSVIETSELTLLRKHVAASLQRAQHLRKPEKDDRAEWPWLMDLTREVRVAMATVFHAKKSLRNDQADQVAQAKWILENLYVDIIGARDSTGMVTDQADSNRRQVELACLLAEVLEVLTGFQEPELRSQRNYIAWISGEFLAGYFMPKALAQQVAQTLKRYFLDYLEGVATNYPDLLPHGKALLQQAIEQLPDLVKQEILNDDELCERAELQTDSVMSVENLAFLRADFIRAIRELTEKNQVQLKDLDEKEIQLAFDPSGKYAILKAPGIEIPLNPIFCRLVNGLTRSDFETLRPWFDCPEKAAKQHFQVLVSTDDPVARFTEATKWQSQSAELRYSGLRQAFASEEERVIGDFLEPVLPERLLARYALGEALSQKKFPARILEASQTLLEESLEIAFARLSCFPVPLPRPLLKKFDTLKPKQLDRFLRNVRYTTASPLARFHLIHMLSGSQRVQDSNLALTLVGEQLSESVAEDIKTLLVILRWARQWFSSRYWASLPEHLILALSWAHAEELFRIIRASNREAREAFSNYLDPSIDAQSPLQEQPSFRQDACYPSNIRPIRFLEAGLGYALSRGPALPEELSAQVEARLFPWGRQSIPSMEYLFRAWGTNTLGSWLGERSKKSLSKIVGPHVTQRLSSQGLNHLATDAIIDLTANPISSDGWIVLASLFRGSGPHPQLQGQLNQVFEKMDINSLLDSQPSDHRPGLLSMICEVAGQLETSRRQAFYSELLRTVAEKRPHELSDPAMVGGLLDAALRLSSPQETQLERAQLFSELACALVSANPGSAQTYIPTLTRLCCRLTPDLARPVWRVLTLARALGKAQGPGKGTSKERL